MSNNTPILELRLTGGNVNPSTLTSKELADLITSLEDSLYHIIKEKEDGISREEIFISLTSIENQSAGLKFLPSVKDLMLASFLFLSMAIRDNNYESLPVKSVENLKRILKFTKSRKCAAEFKYNDKVTAVITEESPIVVPENAYVKGFTTIYAYIKRIGGDEPTVGLRINPKDPYIYVKTTEDIARQLGARLYTTVGLDGYAVWERKTYQLVDFKIERVTKYRDTLQKRAFEGLSELLGPHWDQVDNIDEFLNGE